ncbi:beta-galactosidase GalA [Paenibacillus etheri]|uniref:Glycoside hydrolase family 2 n=1 Tax=Paenibacillus etheri TaxID=1306852 RepID=A0A0W1AVB7_9BACL|nr:beta-galactosidase GalA [Paenibacillus etheri]KTD85255.1 glycoside hydrolase family 2 [Paenibacillus etheri]
MANSKERERINFDADWQFHLGDIPISYVVKAGMTGGITDCEMLEQGEWLDIAFVDKGMESNAIPDDWRKVQLPHDWCVEGEYANDPNLGSRPGSNGYLPTGIGYYVKRFPIPASDLGKKIVIQFDGVMRCSTVWVNGHLIGTHASGYTGFRYELSDLLRYGDEGDNVVCVRVDATEAEGWWYEGCGIYRHVWLETTDRLSVANYGTFITTLTLEEDESRIRIETTIENGYQTPRDSVLVTTIFDQEGHVVVDSRRECQIGRYDVVTTSEIIIVPNPQLWSPNTPYLYTAVSQVFYQGRLTDRYDTSFGIRTIEFTSDRGFLLNGEPLLIHGTCNHQDFAGVGVALPDRLIEYKIELLKEMGCNAYRSAHHPATPELLDICDRLGMLVVDENRKLDSSPTGISDLEYLICRGRNHPSIIMWSLENEEIIEGTVIGARILRTLANAAKKLDPTRPTMAAMNHGWNWGGYAEAVDIVGYNYGQRDGQDVGDHLEYPDRIMVGSESASCTTTRGIYAFDEKHGYLPAYGTVHPSWGCTPEKAWTDVVQNPFLTGVFIWTGFDYRGEPTPFEWPCVNSHFGIMDLCGLPKDSYYYYKSVWTSEPVVHAFPHWSWEGREGETIDVWVYSNCEKVELLLNGRSLGVKAMMPGFHLEWQVEYESGELTTRGYRGGEWIAEHKLVTVGAADRIVLTPDRTELQADGVDLCVVRVAITDDLGYVVPTAGNEIQFSIKGPGRIIGVGNGDPSCHEPDKADRRSAFNGYCIVLIQCDQEAGEIALTASGIGLSGSCTMTSYFDGKCLS